MKQFWRRVGLIVLLLLVFVYLNNSSLWLRPEGRPLLLAHRGLAQTFPMEGITDETNTAARIYEPEHPYLENTIASMEAAFAAGADIVELDIHPSRDGHFVVFHDWRKCWNASRTSCCLFMSKAMTPEKVKCWRIFYVLIQRKGWTT